MAKTREFKKGEAKREPKAPKVVKTRPQSAEATRGGNGFTIIETGGKQYRVAAGDTIKIELVRRGGGKEEFKIGDEIIFDKVLLVDNGADSTDIGTPYIEGAKVYGTLTEIGRNTKVVVIKYKQKSRYFKKQGHRQPYFRVKINKIS